MSALSCSKGGDRGVAVCGGCLQVEHRLETMRIELYCTPSEQARYTFEVILSVWIYCMMAENLWRILYTQYTDGNFLKVTVHLHTC